jgi:plastocyanin
MKTVNSSSSRRKREGRAANRIFRLRLLGICGFVLILVSALVACSRAASGEREVEVSIKPAAPAATGSVIQVSIQNLQFSPATVEIKKGDVLEWKNDDLVPHTATSSHFDSGTMAAGQTWRHRFTEIGKFPYICNFHPQMKGVVNVK